MKDPVLILSDLHLGHTGSILTDARMLEPLLEDCKTLLLNGDSWQQLASDFRAQGESLWTELQKLCREKEVELVILPGNHDPDSGECGWVSFAGGAVAVTHGDAVYAEGAPWSRMAMLLGKEIAALWDAQPPLDIASRLSLSRKIAHLLLPPYIAKSRNILLRVWDAITPPGRALRMIFCWWCMVGQTRRFARDYFPQAKVIICGHFHRAGIWDDGELLVVNTGSYMPPGSAFWCEWSAGCLRVGRVDTSSATFHRGETLDVIRVEG